MDVEGTYDGSDRLRRLLWRQPYCFLRLGDCGEILRRYYSQDPLKRITGLFKVIVEKTNKPVCVFIDDLDRCQADYVVDLLEGIQTWFHHKNVAYVVAADRSWIKASFEARYGSFSNAVGNIGQPLGYLFP